MKRWRLSFAAAAALLLLAALFAARVARHAHGARVELGETKLTRLTDETRARLASLHDRLFLTYYVSDRVHMPSNLRRVEREVTGLLESLKRAGDGKVEYQIVDPDTNPDLAKFASKRAVAPFRSRSVERDGYSEKTVWSTLTISYGPRPEASLPGIGPEHLARLQGLIVAQIDEMENPRKPLVALAAPAGYERLKAYLSQKVAVSAVDFDGGQALPADADLLLWFEPRRADDAALRSLDTWLARGRGIVVAGTEHSYEIRAAESDPPFAFGATPFPGETLWRHFGLRPVRGLVFDERALEMPLAGKPTPVPFLLRCIALDQDFRTFKGQPNGNLAFAVPTPFAADPDELASRGWTYEVLGTSSDKSWIQDEPAGPVTLADLRRDKGEPVAKQPLMARLRPRDPWHGSIMAFAAPTPFQDGWFDHEGVAHERLMKTILDNFASAERLVIHRAGILKRDPIPPMELGGRLLWRSVVVFLFPAALLALAFARGAFGGREPRATKSVAPRRWPLLVGAALAVFAVGLAARAVSGTIPRVDLTEEQLGKLAPASREIAARARGAGAVRAELVFTASEQLPAFMRPWPKRVRATLDEFRRAGADLTVTSVDPADLSEVEKKSLAALGVEPFRATTRDEEVTTVRTVYAALRLAASGRSEVLRFEEKASLENLEFRIAFALWRLETGKHPRIAFASDVPRPSPAESFDAFQQGFVAPVGTDVYSLARRVLAAEDFDVVHVNPREPKLPASLDALLWLQPRRDVTPMYEAFASYLHGGGRAMLAVQHYNIQARQYRGTGFKMVYWPQPQICDVEYLWFPELGLEVVPEVFFDERKTRMTADTQVNRAVARPDIEVQTSALPIVIRASAAGFTSDSIVTKGLGDQAFVWANFLRFDKERLGRLGLHATTLMESSERTWTYPWKGGWIPDELLEGPPKGTEGRPAYLGRLPLAALIEGTFPLPAEKLHLPGMGNPLAQVPGLASKPGAAELLTSMNGETRPAVERPASSPGAPGVLLLVACSEMFKNRRIAEPEFRADQLLVNAAAFLALEPQLAELAVRRPVARGFDYIEPDARLRWRNIVVAAFPAAFLAFGLFRLLQQRRSAAQTAARYAVPR